MRAGRMGIDGRDKPAGDRDGVPLRWDIDLRRSTAEGIESGLDGGKCRRLQTGCLEMVGGCDKLEPGATRLLPGVLVCPPAFLSPGV